jgi:hypothetical protein
MNNFFIILIVLLLILSGSLFFFYTRDILNEDEGEFLGSCVPINLQIKDVLATSAWVEWETSEDCLGIVKYGDSVDSMDYIAVDRENNVAKKKHSIKLEKLKPSSIYYVVVFSEDTEYGIEGTPIIVNTKAF